MGYYINPKNETKEEFLKREAEILAIKPPSVEAIPATKAIVCLVSNGAFTTAGIIYDDGELEESQRPNGRPKIWFLIDRQKLYAVSDIKPEYFQGYVSAAPDKPVEEEVSEEPDRQTGGR